MPQNSTLQQIKSDFTDLNFSAADEFRWSPEEKTVYFNPEFIGEENGRLILLHELGHALLDHNSIENDVDLLKKEVAAWEKARELCERYAITFNDDLAENCLDSYRLWLDKRSTCIECEQTGYQNHELHYTCLNCQAFWKVSFDQKKRVCRVPTKQKA
ncbi:TPA: hypothetical protein EYO12_00025 [Candidatus Saccharibacteria bacterium]|nr:hypothetical protein [Candidatus Saccharibacteria bacterium]HIO87183.1 hypothetical protein [Candidatus Saccharibacteria bacterium]